VQARHVTFKLEDDSDIHLVISDPVRGGTMITEFPDPACIAPRATPLARQLMRNARTALTRACGLPSRSRFTSLRGVATINGVGFFDFKHGQTGVAPNAIELHPVLGFSTSTRCR
jgi:hypothetical protein